MSNQYKPGNICPATIRYAVIGTDGRKTGVFRNVRQGGHFPPTPLPLQQYIPAGPAHEPDMWNWL